MAGGAGKRLWPMSRLSRPKQLLPLLGGQSLLAATVQRLRGCFETENIWIITNAEYADQVHQALPELPRGNIVGEPEGRDTANAIALAAELLGARDPQATMAVFTADHVIRPPQRFQEQIDKACRVAEDHPDALVTFGIRPTWPHTGLGYIQAGEKLEDGVFEVAAFKEKPDHQSARHYVDSGNYLWNSGMFFWSVGAIRDCLRNFLPDSQQKLEPIGQQAAAGEDYAPALAKVYPTLEKISIDYAVMEKAPRVLTVELGCEWLDVGSWPALEDVSQTDRYNNVVQANAVLRDAGRNIIVSDDDHLLAVMGIEDCIVVHTADATLVCPKTKAQGIKDLLEDIAQKHGDAFA
jgi:mannose-1-phosphate guanylyltransferase